MANQKQEVELLIKAGTEGLKSIGQLVKELEALGEDTGEASEKMEGLAGSLKELRDQQKLVKQFRDLKLQTGQLAEEQQNAQQRSTELGKALSQIEKPTRAQRTEFEKARAATIAAGKAYEDNQRELNGLRDSLGEAGISTRDLSSEQQRIKREIAGVDDEISSVTSELTQMRDGAQAAAGGSRQLGDDVQKSGTRVSRFRERLQGLNPVLGKVGAGLKTAGLAVAGFVAAAGASIATLTVFSKGQAKLAEELTNTSNAIGVNAEQLQLWRIAGERVGLSGEQVSSMLRDVTERLGEFSRTGGGEAADVLETLNLKIRDLRDLRPDEQMRVLAEAIGELGSQSEQVALLEMLSSDASQLLPLLEDNAAGLEKIFEQAQREGSIYSAEELEKLNRANDIYNDIDLKLKGLVNRISVELAPTVAEATEKVLDLFGTSEDGEDLIDVFKRLVRQSGDFVKNIAENGASIAERFRTITTAVQFLGNVARTVFNGMMTAVSTFLTMLSGQLAAVLSLVQGVAKALEFVGVISEEAYGKVEGLAERARQKTKELAEQTSTYASDTASAGADVVRVFSDIEDAADGAAKATEENVATLQDLPGEVETAAASAEEALRRQREEAKRARDELADMGVDAELAMTGISTGAREAIDGVSDLADEIQRAGLEGEAAADAFEQGFSEALDAVSSREGLDDLREKIQGLREAGEIGAAGANAALEKIRQKMAELTLQELDLGLSEVGTDAATAADQIDEVKNKTREAAKEAEEASRDMSAMGEWFAAVWTAARTAVTELSDAARNLFERRVGSNQLVEDAETTSEALERINTRLQEIGVSLTRNPLTAFLTKWALETEQTSLEVQKAFYAQASAIEYMQEKVESGAYSMSQLNDLSARAADRFNLLDDQRLSNLQGAIDAARNKMESLSDSAESTLNSLRQRLADIRGDTEEAQRLQYEAERKRLQEQLTAAREAGAREAVAEYEEALRVLKEINKTEQQNRREQDNQREKEAADRQRDQQRAERERQQAERERSTTTNRQQSQASSSRQTIVLQTPGGGETEVETSDPEGFLSVLEQAGLRSAR